VRWKDLAVIPVLDGEVMKRLEKFFCGGVARDSWEVRFVWESAYRLAKMSMRVDGEYSMETLTGRKKVFFTVADQEKLRMEMERVSRHPVFDRR